MAQERRTDEGTQGLQLTARDVIPRVAPRVEVSGEAVTVEFRIEDLVRRLVPSAAGHCGGCYGCSGCSH